MSKALRIPPEEPSLSLTGDLCAKISSGDLVPLFQDQLGYRSNALSPFAGQLSAYRPHTAQASEGAVALAQDALFQKAAYLIAYPDVRVTHRCGGKTASAFTAYCRRTGDAVAVVYPSTEGSYLIRLFHSSAHYFAWWLIPTSTQGNESSDASATFTLPLQTLLYWLHAVDMYRRAHYQHLLSHSASEALTVPVAEFADQMTKSMASCDLHWLLPSFLALTPGLDALKLTPRVAHLKELAARGYLVRGRRSQPKAEPVFYFRDALADIAKEFIDGAGPAMGMEIAVSTDRGVLPVFEGFLAPSRVANHFFEIQPGSDGIDLAHHQPMTQRQLYARLVGLLSAALSDGAPEAAVKRASLRKSRRQTRKKSE